MQFRPTAFGSAFASLYLSWKRRRMPFDTRALDLSNGQSPIVAQWYYDHLPGCRDSGGYVAISLEGGNIIAKSLCESDHPGPRLQDAVFINRVRLGRNEVRIVPPHAEILIFSRINDGYDGNPHYTPAIVQLVPQLGRRARAN